MKKIFLVIFVMIFSNQLFAKQAIIYNKSKVADMEITYRTGHFIKDKGWVLSEYYTAKIPAKRSSDSKNFIEVDVADYEIGLILYSAEGKDLNNNIISKGVFTEQKKPYDNIFLCFASFYRGDIDSTPPVTGVVILDDNNISPLIVCDSHMQIIDKL